MKDEEKKILKNLRSDVDTCKDSIAIAEKGKRKRTARNSRTLHNVLTNSITVMNNLLYAGAHVVAEKLGKMEKNKRNKKRKEPWRKRRIQVNIAEWRKDVSRLN